MITDSDQETQLPISNKDSFKSKICQKDECSEPCIPRGKFCESHKTKSMPKCKHGKRKVRCKECGGSELCKHSRIKGQCKECGGNDICKHGKRKTRCKECGGGSICKHDKVRSTCKECDGGEICKHDKVRFLCKECDGGSFCDHGARKTRCKECNFKGYLAEIVRSRIYKALVQNKEFHSQEYLGCEIPHFKEYIESKFQDDMSWDNYGKWEIDHIIPIKYKENNIEPTLEEVIKRLHYTNTQPMWASENASKCNRYIGEFRATDAVKVSKWLEEDDDE